MESMSGKVHTEEINIPGWGCYIVRDWKTYTHQAHSTIIFTLILVLPSFSHTFNESSRSKQGTLGPKCVVSLSTTPNCVEPDAGSNSSLVALLKVVVSEELTPPTPDWPKVIGIALQLFTMPSTGSFIGTFKRPLNIMLKDSLRSQLLPGNIFFLKKVQKV